MIDTSKLKYYKSLCENGVLDKRQNDLDDIMNTLEEKQFEYLKRLETTKDESRKDEINEILNTIDLQLKEIGSLKSAISAGIIIDPKNASVTDDKKKNEDTLEAKDNKENKGKKKSKTGIIITVVVIAIAVAAVAVFMLNGKTGNQNTATDDEDNNATKIGIAWFYGPDVQKQAEEQDAWVEGANLSKGLYVYDIANQSLIDGGLQLGDRLLTLNGEAVDTEEKAVAVINEYQPGDEALLVVSRGFDEVTVKGKFVSPSELLDYKTSGEATFEIDGRPFRVTYGEDSFGISMWQFPEEN